MISRNEAVAEWGISGVSTGDVIADGDTKEKALLALACSAVCTIDALNQPLPEKSQP